MTIDLPWPPSSLSGHAKGNWHAKAAVTKKHREWAAVATRAAGTVHLAPDGDIGVHVTFQPPTRRGDRVNFPNRMKPYFDGIAEALGVNDSRFLPAYAFGDVVKGGNIRIVVEDTAI